MMIVRTKEGFQSFALFAGGVMPMPIEVVWYGGQRGSWCQGIVEWLTTGFTHRMNLTELQGEGAVIVIKSDWDKDPAKFCYNTAWLKWILLIVTANEEGNNNYHGSLSPACKVWLQTPHRHQEADRYLPWGWTPGCSIDVQSKKDLDCSFAGQITHKRRWDLMSVFPEIAMLNRKWEFHGSDGFAKGISQAEYYTLIGRSKVVPCPSGPFTVDSMRVCEALQLGSLPVLDAASPTGLYPEYWERIFGEYHPLEIIYDWSDFPGRLEHLLEYWPMYSSTVSKFWQHWKANLQTSLIQDLHELGAM
jgi:hypothetical protein